MTLSDLPARYREQAVKQMLKKEKVLDKELMTITPSTEESKLNKTEKAYLSWLRGQGYVWIGIQAITLKLGDDTRYTCDFMALDSRGDLHGREVKGFFRDDAKVKIKVAARQFPFIKFYVVKKDGQGWNHKEVKP